MERFGTIRDWVYGDRIFQVPLYQRNYSWEESQWEDLWNDLWWLDVGKKHYFGTILLKRKPEQKKTVIKSFELFEVVDGQQRLTTILIFLNEILTQLEKIGDAEIKEPLQDLRKGYLKYSSGIYKLELLGEDSEFFRRYIIEGEECPEQTFTPSQMRLKNAKQFFKRKLEEIKTSDVTNFRNNLRDLVEKISNLEIIRYAVDKDSDAILIFETVNNRGKRLSDFEKTKSFLMHLSYLSAPDEEEAIPNLEQINTNFANMYRYFQSAIYTNRGKEVFPYDIETALDAIQRYHFIVYVSDNKRNSQNYLDFLKDKVRAIYRSRAKSECLGYVLEYAKDLETAFYTFNEILAYEEKDNLCELINRLVILGRIATFNPLLIAAWIKFRDEKKKIEKILELLEIYVFRVWVIGRNRSDAGDSTLYSLANKIHNDHIEFNQILEEIRELIRYYESDMEFEEDLHSESFYRRVRSWEIRYLLFEYETWLRNQAKEPLDVKLGSILSDDFTVEHIWPDEPLGLPDNLKEIHEKYEHKLGNLTLASKSWNSSFGRLPFEQKRTQYKDSNLRVQRDLVRHTTWGPNQIDTRGTQIANFVLSKWRV